MTDAAPDAPRAVVTVSATYGAGGSVIAPALAARLGLTFVDRVITARQADALESLSEEERDLAPPSRWVAAMAKVAAMVPSVPIPNDELDPVVALRKRNDEHLAGARTGGPSLFLGRGAAIALATVPHAFHIRLDGPLRRRIPRAAAFEHISEDEAARRCKVTDEARSNFVRRLYDADSASAGHYHVVLDTTVYVADDAVALLADAARRFWAQGDATA